MKKNKRILVIGNFGYLTNDLNGQTIKTRSIYNLISDNLISDTELLFFDTAEIYFNKFIFFDLLLKIFNCNKVVYIPALKSFSYFFPFLFLFSKIFSFKIIHIPVGGRHNEFLKKRKLHRYLLSKIQLNAPQTKKEVLHLKNNFKFKNTIYFPNFRIHNFKANVKLNESSFFKICFLARVTPLKGIDVILRLSDVLLKKQINNITIDLYGPIEKGYEEEFNSKINKNKLVNYNGLIQPKQIYNTLNSYDVLLLPTRYPGEGFPGTILESYISGIPVIVSKWRHLPEFVKHGETGFLFDLDKEDDLYSFVKLLKNNPKKLYDMKLNALNESKLYSSSFAWSIIKKYLK